MSIEETIEKTVLEWKGAFNLSDISEYLFELKKIPKTTENRCKIIDIINNLWDNDLIEFKQLSKEKTGYVVKIGTNCKYVSDTNRDIALNITKEMRLS